MPERTRAGFEYSVCIMVPPAKVLAAFFDARALAAWWDVARVVATPRPLGVYALEWRPSADRDDVLGRLGGVFHGTVVDFQAGRGFFVGDCYWLPPDGEPIGPMALDVTCSPVDTGAGGARRATRLRVAQRGADDGSARWCRYYEVIGAGWPRALETMKDYLEKGRGVWDLRGYD